MRLFKYKLFALANAIWSFITGLLTFFFRGLLDLFFRLIDLILPLTAIAFFIKKHARPIWDWATSIGFVKRAISRNVFRKFGDAAPARPHAYTMAAEFTTWNGFVDRTFTGRHLKESPANPANYPEAAALVELFMRGDGPGEVGNQIDCTRSTVMFAAFAQWFTDSFLRTEHAFDFDDEGNVKRDGNNAPIRIPGREKRNTSNHEIDLCQIYGLNEKQTSILRVASDAPAEDRGCLKYQMGADGEYSPFLLKHAPQKPTDQLSLQEDFQNLHPDERIIRSIFLRANHNEQGYESIFVAGLEHSNATIGNALLNTVFLREHNRIARLIANRETHWDGERVFQTTRNVMIVLLLKIVISDYIRHISPLGLPLEFQPGFAEKQLWYRTNRISIEFNLLYRWHSLVPNEFSFMPNPKDPASFRHNNKWLMDKGVGAAITHFSNERAGRIIMGNTPRFLEGVKRDTMKLMRDAKLASYNDYRERFGLSKADEFSDITKDAALAQKLSDLYGGEIDRVEWYIGMLCEDHGPDMIMGELLMTMVAHDAFTQALTNPLLSNEAFHERTFSKEGWRAIEETSTLNDIVQRVTTGDVHCAFSQFER